MAENAAGAKPKGGSMRDPVVRDAQAGAVSRPSSDEAATVREQGHDRGAPHAAQSGTGGTAPALGRNPEVEESALPPHEPGSMDIAYHEKTYQTFVRIVIRAVFAIFAVLILLALING